MLLRLERFQAVEGPGGRLGVLLAGSGRRLLLPLRLLLLLLPEARREDEKAPGLRFEHAGFLLPS